MHRISAVIRGIKVHLTTSRESKSHRVSSSTHLLQAISSKALHGIMKSATQYKIFISEARRNIIQILIHQSESRYAQLKERHEKTGQPRHLRLALPSLTSSTPFPPNITLSSPLSMPFTLLQFMAGSPHSQSENSLSNPKF